MSMQSSQKTLDVREMYNKEMQIYENKEALNLVIYWICMMTKENLYMRQIQIIMTVTQHKITITM